MFDRVIRSRFFKHRYICTCGKTSVVLWFILKLTLLQAAKQYIHGSQKSLKRCPYFTSSLGTSPKFLKFVTVSTTPGLHSPSRHIQWTRSLAQFYYKTWSITIIYICSVVIFKTIETYTYPINTTVFIIKCTAFGHVRQNTYTHNRVLHLPQDSKFILGKKGTLKSIGFTSLFRILAKEKRK